MLATIRVIEAVLNLIDRMSSIRNVVVKYVKLRNTHTYLIMNFKSEKMFS